MRLLPTAALLLGALLPLTHAAAAAAPAPAPAPAFHNIDLARQISLDKAYPRETITATIENVSDDDQRDYVIYFPPDIAARVGGLEVREAKVDGKGKVKGRKAGRLDVEEREDGVFAARFAAPVAPHARLTLSITYSLLHSLHPLPRTIEQDDPQFLSFEFPKYIPSIYPTRSQHTSLRFPTPAKIASFSPGQLKGSTLSYGPYNDVAPTNTNTSTEEEQKQEKTAEKYAVRYEHTTPLPHTPLLTRHLTVSHLSSSIAYEDAYNDFTNAAANLSHPFSRVAWTLQAYHGLTSTAAKELRINAGKGARDAWFVDDVGNVSTSRFREADGSLEIRPRYPVFGGWRYGFRVGWSSALAPFLQREGEEYVLGVPLLNVPVNREGMTIDALDLRVSLPEGAEIVAWDVVPATAKAVVPARAGIVVGEEREKTFLDTVGRTVLRLRVEKVSDESRGVDVVVRYRLSWFDEVVRKPGLVAVVGLMGVVGWVVVGRGVKGVGIRGRKR